MVPVVKKRPNWEVWPSGQLDNTFWNSAGKEDTECIQSIYRRTGERDVRKRTIKSFTAASETEVK